MRYLFFFLFVLTALLGAAQPMTPFSEMDIFELEWVANPQISPNGEWVVYERKGMDIMTDQRQSRLWLIKTDGNEHQKMTSSDMNESQPIWSSDGQKIAFTRSTLHGTEIYVYWINTGKEARLTQLNRSPGGLSWSPDNRSIAFSMLVPTAAPSFVSPPQKPKGAKWAEAPRVTTRLKHESDGQGYIETGFRHLFVLSADGGSARQITHGDLNHGKYPVWSRDGHFIYFSGNLNEDWEYDYGNSEIYRIKLADEKIQVLTERKGPDYNLVISPDGKKIAYLGYDDKIQTYQMNHIYTMNVDGSDKKIIPLSLDRFISDIEWTAGGGGLTFKYDDKGDTKIAQTTLKGEIENIARNLGGTSIGRPYSSGSYSQSQNGVFAYTYTDPYSPAALAIYQKGSSESAVILDLNTDLLPFKTLGRVQEVWYQSSIDKIDIQGWIVTPPNYKKGEKYPLIVENHGGPIMNYGSRFSPEIQLYANAGYVVFYPNPRGSTGYGETFGNLLYHDYPGGDYQDVMDGVDLLIKKGFTTEDSLFVTGGSAGGIMTAWMIGKNNRFRAAAVVKPVINWISKTLTADNYFQYANYRYPGQPWENMETYWKYSPISLVGQIETPTIIIVGMADLRTPISEAKQLYHALKIRKIETALVEIPGSSHFIARRPSHLISKVAHVLAWFEKYR